jgi:hypothetical protein
MASRVNVVHGDFVARSLAMAIHPLPGELLVHQDVLSCGPVLPCATVEQWRSARREYWETVPSADESSSDPTADDLLSSLTRLRDADAIVLWLGTGTSDQLLLAWIARLLELADLGSPSRLAVVQFTAFGKREHHAWSVGLLNAEEIAGHPAPVQLSMDAVPELRRCWAAITAREPTPLLSFVAESSAHLPFLQPSLRALLDRFPDRRTGLGRWDTELLKYANEHGPSVARAIAYTLVDHLDADMVGDGYLLSRLRRLADPALPHPLVELVGDATVIRGCEVALTEAGKAVLAGRANAVEMNGIDDWVLGVHLDSAAGEVWYRDGVGLVHG